MFGSTPFSDFDQTLEAPQRHRRLPRLALRQRSSDHPMVMFAMLVSAAFVSMALMLPASGAALPTNGAPARIVDVADVAKPAAPKSAVERACEGEAWGAESEVCLAAIAKASGKNDRVIRMVTADQLKTTPNIY